MPGIRQVGDFIAAIYSPYTTYGVDEVSRYDTFYGDYGVDNRRHSPQYRNVRWGLDIGISLIYGFGSWRMSSTLNCNNFTTRHNIVITHCIVSNVKQLFVAV